MSKTVGLVILALAAVVGLTGGQFIQPTQTLHAATPSVSCGAVDLSRFTPVNVNDAFNGKVPLARVRVEGQIVMNIPGDYTDFHIQVKTKAWDGSTFSTSFGTESVQEYRAALSPAVGSNVYIYGYLRFDAYHRWWEIHPAVAYATVGKNGAPVLDSTPPTCQAPATSAYIPQTVTQVANGLFLYPRTQIVGKVVGITTYKSTPSFWLSDGTSKILCELNPEFVSVTMPKLGQTVTVFGSPRQDGTAQNRWEINPVYQIS